MKNFISFFLLIFSCSFCVAQEHVPDGNTSLLLHFNNNTWGTSGESPTSQTSIGYTGGVFNNAINYSAASILTYSASNNLQASAGTFEAWVKPNWNGNDGQDHYLASWGGAGGMLIGKDGGNYLKIIVNRYGASGGNPEKGAGYNISSWAAGQWYHIACTWSASELKLYVNGSLVSQSTVGFSLPAVTSSTFHIGSDNGNSKFNAAIEELRISNSVRSATEISQSFQNGSQITGIVVNDNNVELYPTWRYKPDLSIVNANGTFPVSPSEFTWTTSNTNIAYVATNGDVIAVAPGTVILTATKAGFTVSLTIIVKSPAATVQNVNQMDPFLKKPADCYKELMRVVILNYLPTINAVNLDLSETGPIPGPNPMPLSTIENTITTNNIQLKHMLEERSKFHGYKDPTAAPYLGYQVIDYINIYEPMPRYKDINQLDGTKSKLIDYQNMSDRFNWQHYIETLDVDEFWIWGYHTNEVVGWESNMSSPTTGDISNSDRDNTDLPIFNKTYMAYWFNYSRTPNLHNQGHQLESIFSHINNNMFWGNFVGSVNGAPPLGRAGDTHRPPNTTVGYDYFNTTLVASDIENWHPNGGPTKLINTNTWGNLDYNWPYGIAPIGEQEANYYIYWMQNMPGYENNILYNGFEMNNWWEYIADWDNAHLEDLFVPVDNSTPINYDLYLDIVFDNFAEDISWDVRNDNNDIIASGFRYQNGLVSTTEYICFEPGCFTLNIYDSYGDGLCCTNGNGSYILYDVNGVVYTNGATFGFQDTKQFCVPEYLEVRAKVNLEGPFNSATGTMFDQLRASNNLPVSEPYSALGFTYVNQPNGETTDNASVFNVAGNNAIVDWIFLEIRPTLTPTFIVSSRSALLQRDGDIVEVDGVSPVRFDGLAGGTYHLAVRHRNHLGAMATNVVLDRQGSNLIDFTSPTTTVYGNNAQVNRNGELCLWAGNTTYDAQIDASDRSTTWNLRNQSGYLQVDCSLDGVSDAGDRSITWNNRNIAEQLP